jgi:hypothetical protein
MICRTAQKINHSQRLHKRSITVRVHGSLGAHPSVFYWGYWRINNDWDFVTKGNHQCLVTFTHSEPWVCTASHMSTVLTQHMNTWPHTAPLCFQRIKWLGKSPPSTLQFRPSPLRQPSIWVYKGSDERLEWETNEAVQKLSTVVYELLKSSSIAGEFSKFLEWWQKCIIWDGDFVQMWI